MYVCIHIHIHINIHIYTCADARAAESGGVGAGAVQRGDEARRQHYGCSWQQIAARRGG